ncbi:tRNA (cytosine(38)-C(5))-methyltransferase [Fopius arisanus]|uniref:tRNA (cytosine(38)-C(5))-methyltransferase n=1 Tax=Fopius arisanus TaxID=64838 RepID=A0A0C9RIU5_9HYME|nr:PREDICTED: tRNA (cytosine(38)-C(5))-methyltransferase [Fopius arisanus]
MRIIELYSGIGGMHYALKESEADGTIIAAIDINTVANEVYRYNFPSDKIISRNIESISPEELKKLNIEGILMSPPCQPFTRLGLQKDKNDRRTCSLFQVLKIIKHLETLKVILMENVMGFEKSETRDSLIQTIQDTFNYKELILSPNQFGIPNSRKRYYLIAKRKNLNFLFDDSSLVQDIPESIRKILPTLNKINLLRIQNILEDDETDENKLERYVLSEETVQKRLNVLDVRGPDSAGSCCFTKAYSRYAEGTGSVYSPLPQSRVDESISIIENTEDPEERLELIRNLRLRYFTPKEVSRLMSFPEDFSFPNSTTDKQKYRLLGNSINVHVVSQLIRILMNS